MRFLLSLPLLIVVDAAAAQIEPATRDPAPRLNPLPSAAGPRDPESWRDTRDIREKVEQGRSSGQLPLREARRLRGHAAGIDAAAAVYASDGLSASEERELAVRAQVLRDQVLARRSRVDARPAAAMRDQRGR